MKYSLSMAMLAFASVEVSATFFGGKGFHNAQPFGCPKNIDNHCVPKQKPGLGYGDLPPGKELNPGDEHDGFKYGGGKWKCGANKVARDIMGRTFGGEHFLETECGDGVIPSIELGSKDAPNAFSMTHFDLDLEADGIMELEFEMAHGGRCKCPPKPCKAGRNTLTNDQCGGAKKVHFKYKPHKGGKCKGKFHHIDFDCDNHCKPGEEGPNCPPKDECKPGEEGPNCPPKDECKPGEEGPNCPPKDECKPGEEGPNCPPKDDEECKPGEEGPNCPPKDDDECKPGEEGPNCPPKDDDECKPGEEGPNCPPKDDDECKPGEEGPNCPPKDDEECKPGEEGPNCPPKDDEECKPGEEGPNCPPKDDDECKPGEEGPNCPPKDDEECKPGEEGPNCPPQTPGGDNPDTPATTPSVPEQPEPTDDEPEEDGDNSPETPVVTPPSSDSPATTPSNPEQPQTTDDKPEEDGDNSPETPEPTSSASDSPSTSSSNPDQPKPTDDKPEEDGDNSPETPEEEGPECPDVVPRCLKTWLPIVGACKNGLDKECYCKAADVIDKVYDCIYANAESDDTIAQAIQALQGICAEDIPENPAIVTGGDHITSYITVTGTPIITSAIYTTISIDTTVTVPCVEDGTTISGSSTTKVIKTEVPVPEITMPAPPAETGSENSPEVPDKTNGENSPETPEETGGYSSPEQPEGETPEGEEPSAPAPPTVTPPPSAGEPATTPPADVPVAGASRSGFALGLVVMAVVAAL